MLKAKWNLRVAKLRCDNGCEYKNNELISWCKQMGMVMDLYTPQLNGKSERLNRTLMETARALVEDAGMNV